MNGDLKQFLEDLIEINRNYKSKYGEIIMTRETNTKVKRFREITDNMADLYERKNKDYGDSFSNSLDEFGVIAGVVRLSDKMNRIKALTKNGEQLVLDESIKDTLQDLANYSIMTLMWLEGRENEV